MGIFPLLLLPVFAFSQQLTVKGRVTGAENGEALPGVTVRVKGGTAGTVSGPDGAYSLSLKQSNVSLVFTFTGYVTQEVPVAGNQLDVVLQTSKKDLDEVVVVGYGTQQKANVAGAIVSVKSYLLQATSWTWSYRPVKRISMKLLSLVMVHSRRQMLRVLLYP